MAKNMVSVRGSHRASYSAPDVRIGRSQFNRSHRHKTSFDAGELIPFYVDEVIPGDTFTMKMNAFARIFSPLGAPIMDDIEMSIDFFFVPCRLVWDNWKYFMGEHNAAGAQDTSYTIPIITTAATVAESTPLAAMGVPIGLDCSLEDVNALPIRAFYLIYNEWYRDQNLIDEVNVPTTDAQTALGNGSFPKSAKRHDYFTSCLPYLQKGDAQGVLGTQTTLDVETNAVQGNDITIVSGSGQRDLDSSGANVIVDTTNTGSAMFVDVSSLSVDINTLRESLAIQRMLEKDARGGTRYNELIKAHFGVTVPDYRVQRPEYLGGGKGYINISPVANTSPVDATASPDGEDWDSGRLAGTGAGTLRGGFAKSFTEHGYVLGILRARGELSYQQGLDRMWSRSTREDFYFPDLAHLGEQAVLNKELWIQGDATDDDVFGYQERFAEYRFKKSLVTGVFNSDHTGTIDYWHLAEDFASQPALNQTFIEDATPMSRVTTVTSQPDFIIDGFFDLRCARPMPVRAIPSILGFGRL